MKLIRWSVGHPAAVLAIYGALLVVAGLALVFRIPLRLAPAIESPLLGVVTEVMDLPADQVEALVTNPLERALSGVGGARYVRSSSMRGMSIITLEFPYHYDMRRALQEATATAAAVASTLQIAARARGGPWVRRFDPLDIPVLRLAVRAPSWTSPELRGFLDTVVRSRLQQVPGVHQVWAFGGAPRPWMAMVDREALQARGLSMIDIRRALDDAAPIAGSGVTSDPVSGVATVQAVDDASPEALGALAVTAPDGRRYKLRELASFSLGEATSRYRCNGEEAIELNITQRPDGSAPTTIAGVREALAEVERHNPGVRFEEAYDNARFVEIVGRNVWLELGLAVLLTGLVIWFFLGDSRGTLIALATIPTSLACALIMFVPLGLSLNSSTLVGLLLAIGRLVDDTIIDLHAVSRHRALGKSARDAAVDGCSEVRRAVIGATVVICLAMLPLTFAGGLTQDMFEGLVWPFLLSLAASLGVALTLTPVLAAWAWDGVAYSPPRGRVQRAMARLEVGYRGALGHALRHPALVLTAAFAACYLSWSLWPLVGSEMMPLSDTGQLYCVLEARPGSSLEETSRLAAQLEDILRRQPEVLKVSTEVGPPEVAAALTGYGARGPATATLLVTLTDKDARARTIWDIADRVWAQATATIPHLRRLSLKEMGSDVMATAMAPIELVIHGPDLDRLAWLAEQTRALAEGTGGGDVRGLRQVGTAWSLQQETVRVRFRDAALVRHGLTRREAGEQLLLAMGGGSRVAGRPLMLAYADEQRRSPRDAGRVILRGAGGHTVALGEVAEVDIGSGPDMIEHDNLQRCSSVVGSYRNGGPGSMQLEMDLLMASRMRLPYPPGYDIEQRGDMTQMMDAFGRLLWGLVAALGMMYVALVVQFGSMRTPLAVLAAIPLELPGVLVALLVAHQTFSTVSLLGLVVLNGMDVTASILLLDAVAARRLAGGALREAIAEAAPTRLRPVLMTVMVTMAVMLPLALFPRTGMDAYAPLATVVAGGLAVSTVLTLGVVPVLYSLLEARAGAAGNAPRGAN